MQQRYKETSDELNRKSKGTSESKHVNQTKVHEKSRSTNKVITNLGIASSDVASPISQETLLKVKARKSLLQSEAHGKPTPPNKTIESLASTVDISESKMADATKGLIAQNTTWHHYKNLLINKEHFGRGFIVVKDAPRSESPVPFAEEAKETPLVIKERELCFSDIHAAPSSQLIKSHKLLFEITKQEKLSSISINLLILNNWDELNNFENPGYILVKTDVLTLYYKNSNNKIDITNDKLQEQLKSLDLIQVTNKKLPMAHKLNLKQLEQLTQLYSLHHTISIYNQKRREEVFISLPDIGLYINPWLSNSPNHTTFGNFSGFERFCTAGCMFGSKLRGIDDIQSKTPLIKHDKPFYHGQLFTSIDFNMEKRIPYEEELFIELNRIAHFIETYGTKTKKPFLSYHLPYYDYILFGIELFIHNKLTFTALNDFCKTIMKHKEVHKEKVQKICKEHNIEVCIQSPFENLFDAKTLERHFIKNMLCMLKVINPLSEQLKKGNDFRDIKPEITNEAVLVAEWLKLLMTNKFNLAQQKVWTDFIKKSIISKMYDLCLMSDETKPETGKIYLREKDGHFACSVIISTGEFVKDIVIKELKTSRPLSQAELDTLKVEEILKTILKMGHTPKKLELETIDDILKNVYKAFQTIDDLFKVANATILGLTTLGIRDYQACSILPVSEKQIQVCYDKLIKEEKDDVRTQSYPGILNATYIPTIIPDNSVDIAKIRGLLFYSTLHPTEVAKLITILSPYAHLNMQHYVKAMTGPKTSQTLVSSAPLHALDTILKPDNSPPVESRNEASLERSISPFNLNT